MQVSFILTTTLLNKMLYSDKIITLFSVQIFMCDCLIFEIPRKIKISSSKILVVNGIHSVEHGITTVSNFEKIESTHV